jgi:O-antigen/teichoic acid export membrane protein
MTLVDSESSSNLRRRLVRGALGSGGLNVFYTGMMFVTTVALTRTLGASSFGVYAQVLAVVALVGVVATPGIERLLIRDMAVYQAKAQHQLARGLMIASNRVVLGLSLIISVLAGVTTWLLNGQEVTTTVVEFWVGYTVIPLYALSRTRAATIMGLRYVVWSQLPESIVRPVLFLGLVVAAQLSLKPFTPTDALILTSMAASAAFLLGAYLLHRAAPSQVRRATPAYDLRRWRRSASPFLLLSIATVINSQMGTALLGALSTSTNAGLFAVANRGAAVISLGVLAATTVVAPNAARLWALGDHLQLQRIVTRSSQATVLFALPVTLILVVFGRYFLKIFGEDFGGAILALQILCVGQFAVSATGTVTNLLLMAGEERRAVVATVVGAVANIVLSVVLIPIWGLEGAAVATTTSLIASELLMLRFARKALGVHLTLLGRVKASE